MADVDPQSETIPPPPLFSPHVLFKDTKAKRTYGETGYLEDATCLEPHMVGDYKAVVYAFKYAQQFNYNISWQREVEITVLEARGLSTDSGNRVHDVRCKVEVASQIGRTQVVSEIYEGSRSFLWNEQLRFQVTEPVNIRLLAYCKNLILPNVKLGRITISPDQLIERTTVTEWYPFAERGEVKLSIFLSPPIATLYKYTMCRPITWAEEQEAFE